MSIKGIEKLTKYEVEILGKNIEEIINDPDSLFYGSPLTDFRVSQKPFSIDYKNELNESVKGRVLCTYTSSKEQALLEESAKNLVHDKEYLLENHNGERKRVIFDKNTRCNSRAVHELKSDKLYMNKHKYTVLIRIPALNFPKFENPNTICYFDLNSTTKVFDLEGNLVWVSPEIKEVKNEH